MNEQGKDELIRGLTDRWDILLEALDKYYEIINFIDDDLINRLLDQDLTLTQNELSILSPMIQTIYGISRQASDLEALAIELNQNAALSKEIDQILMWAVTLDDDDFGPILELKREFETNELARELYLKWQEGKIDGKGFTDEFGHPI